MTINLPALLLSIAAASLMGCAGDGAEIDLTQPLSGTVGGEPWIFAAGETNAFLSEGEDDFFAELYSSAYTACGAAPFGNRLIVAVPKTPGEYDFTTQRNMTFVIGGNENLVSFEGKVLVEEVTATSVTGGLVGSYDSDNEVNGTFELTICTQ